MTKNTSTMTTDQATAITADIVAAGTALATSRTAFTSVITKAKKGDAHTALGYASWTEYVADTFANVKGLGKADTDYLVGFMAGEGMSGRAVARALNVSPRTAARMIAKAVETGEVDADRKTEGTDGKTRKATKKAPAKKTTAKATAKAPASVSAASTDDLRVTALSVLSELSKRWEDGDESAEAAMTDLRDAMADGTAALAA